MILAGTGAAATPPSSHLRQARFSRLVTNTKYSAGSTSSCSLWSYPITVIAWPQLLQVHCSGVQAITRSTRGKFAGSSCRPGCRRGRFVLTDSGRGPRSLSIWTSRLLTPGSSSRRSSWASLSFSLPGPYFWMRCNRKRSSNTWILRWAQCSCRFSSATSADSLGAVLAGPAINKTIITDYVLFVAENFLWPRRFWLLAHDSPKPRPALASCQIDAAQKQRQFLVTEHHLDLSTHRSWPAEAAFL